jgi:exonuclease SbcC
MKILSLHFKNLNSLAGEWTIDLTHPAYASDGIFAITGPTGAGKSTILDAICLALYGSTPRLDKITSANEIMSRQTGECFSEVVFETPAGRFRCHWSQQRARKRVDGRLQDARHEISNADTGEVLHAKLKDVAAEVESVTGMDFTRFTRTMLLAQGGFAAFLQASPKERSPILEQITGTRIYSDISIRVHERNRAEQARLDELKAETSAIAILDAAQERDIGQSIEAKAKEETALADASSTTAKAIAWLAALDGLAKDLDELAGQAGELDKAREAFKPEAEQLARALKAASLEGAFATLRATRAQQRNDHEALTKQESALPALEADALAKAEASRQADNDAHKAKGALEAEKPVIAQIRSLDQRLADQKEILREGEAACRRDAARIAADEQAMMAEEARRVGMAEELDRVEAYCVEHRPDEWLVANLAGVEEQVNGLIAKQREIVRKTQAVQDAQAASRKAAEALDAWTAEAEKLKREQARAAAQLQREKEALAPLLENRLLREYRADKDALLREKALLAQIAKLEDLRAKLEDGKPCPLCGAEAHPYAAGNVPAADDVDRKIAALAERIEKAEEHEAAIRKCEAAESKARSQHADAEKQEALAAGERKSAERAVAEADASLRELRDELATRRRSLFEKLQPLGVAEDVDADFATLLETLRERLRQWQGRLGEQARLGKALAALDSAIRQMAGALEVQRASLEEKQPKLEEARREIAETSDRRKNVYGDKDPVAEERRLSQAIADAEGRQEEARDRHDQIQRQWHLAKDRIDSLKTAIAGRESELRGQETEFAAARASAGFVDEISFLAARLDPGVREALTARANELERRLTELKARRDDREKRLQSEQARRLTDETLEVLQPRFERGEAALKSLRDELADLRTRLRQNEEARERLKGKQAAIEAQERECGRWARLHELIGSADGTKFRNFAQGLTFEMMIGHANRQLRKMSDRYLLVLDATEPLELDVVDNYQAGATRSTKNLSGGESFIVSLALALGLSHMSSRNVRVDSLFLDEGFGTLDDEALDMALETLAGLRQDGKLIGVISHVLALKERIATQIQVTPVSGGRSRIAGPGCQGVA